MPEDQAQNLYFGPPMDATAPSPSFGAGSFNYSSVSDRVCEVTYDAGRHMPLDRSPRKGVSARDNDSHEDALLLSMCTEITS